MRHTPYAHILRETGLTLEEIHRISGVSINTLRSLSSGRNRSPQCRTRAKLAVALRQHSAALAALADQLEAG